jgi:hypothetical protein
MVKETYPEKKSFRQTVVSVESCLTDSPMAWAAYLMVKAAIPAEKFWRRTAVAA